MNPETSDTPLVALFIRHPPILKSRHEARVIFCCRAVAVQVALLSQTSQARIGKLSVRIEDRNRSAAFVPTRFCTSSLPFLSMVENFYIGGGLYCQSGLQFEIEIDLWLGLLGPRVSTFPRILRKVSGLLWNLLGTEYSNGGVTQPAKYFLAMIPALTIGTCRRRIWVVPYCTTALWSHYNRFPLRHKFLFWDWEIYDSD
jgi:hypothetical protein